MSMKVMSPVVCATWPMFPIALVRNHLSVKRAKRLEITKKAYEYFESMQEHLKENGLKLEETDYIVGRTLEFDAKN